MKERNIKIAIIIGSTRPKRVGATIGKWVHSNLSQDKSATYDVVDLAEENLPFLMDQAMPAMQNYDQESTKKWAKKVESYDGYILVTSEYNAGPPAPLKNALDTVYREWAKKPVAFVGYGWMGGVRAIENLITIVARMDMVPLSAPAIHVLDIGVAVDEDGNIKQEHVRGNFEKFEDNLIWWATTLKAARGQK